MSKYYQVLRRANMDQELFQRFNRPANTKQEDIPVPAEPAEKVQDTFPPVDRPEGIGNGKRPRLDLEALNQKEEELFQRFGRPANTKQEDIPIPAEPAEKVQDTFPPVDRPEGIGNGKRPRLDLEALNQEEEIKLIQRVFLLPGTKMPRVVVFSGIGHGTGCSSICARASEILAAQVTGSVCVVDANLRSPHLHQYFGVNDHPGLTEAVLQSNPIRDFTQQLSTAKLWLITCGLKVSSHHALLVSDRLQPRITELRSEFDYVLIDTPPITQYADATLLGRLADGIVLIIEANSTRREAARKVKENLKAANLPVLAAVLNKRTYPIPNFLYRRL